MTPRQIDTAIHHHRDETCAHVLAHRKVFAQIKGPDGQLQWQVPTDEERAICAPVGGWVESGPRYDAEERIVRTRITLCRACHKAYCDREDAERRAALEFWRDEARRAGRHA